MHLHRKSSAANANLANRCADRVGGDVQFDLCRSVELRILLKEKFRFEGPDKTYRDNLEQQ